MTTWDVIIIGGGPAGLSAALVLGRCRRRVLLVDAGEPRNAAARHMHNYLSRDGIVPGDLLRIGREEVRRYDVDIIDARVTNARCCAPAVPVRNHAAPSPNPRTGFEVTIDDGRTFRSRKLLLATGVRDQLPGIPGFRELYGKGVHHCPYCDAYDYADQRLIAFGQGDAAAGLALSLRTWSDDITVCTHGSPMDSAHREQLETMSIPLREQHVVELVGDGQLSAIRFEDGPDLECDALFFNTEQTQRSGLPAMLGCEYDPQGNVVTQAKQHTCVSGLYLAGDADGDVQFVIVAAAEGATAATAINRDLQDEDCGKGEPLDDAWRFRD